MRKYLLLILSALLIFSQPITARAATKSIQSIGQEQQINNADDSYVINYGPQNQRARVVYGANGIDILQDDGTVVHFDTTFAVLKLAVLRDVNHDGYVDFYTYQNASRNADNLFAISGKDGSVLSSLRLVRPFYDQSLGLIEVNTTVLMMQAMDEAVLLVSDYHLMKVDPLTGNILFDYENPDNIWDFILYQNRILLIDQLGYVSLLDGETGEVIDQIKASEDVVLEDPYKENQQRTVTMNLWDLYMAQDGTIYVTSENGHVMSLQITENEIGVAEDIDLQLLDEDRIKALLVDQYDWRLQNYYSTGLYQAAFKSFRIIDENEQSLLISAYSIDKDFRGQSTWMANTPKLIVFDKAKKTVTLLLELSEYSGYVTGLLTKDGETDTLTVVDEADGAFVFAKYDYNGNKLSQKTAAVNATGGFFRVSRLNDQYLMEIYNGGCVTVDPTSYEATYLYDLISTKLLYVGDDFCLVEMLTNGQGKRIVKYANDFRTVLWQYDLNIEDRNKGFNYIVCEDYNGDEVVDVMTLVNRVDENDVPRASHFLFINGADGSIMEDRTIKTGTQYDEKGKPYQAYLVIERFTVLPDLDKDGKREIETSGTIITTKKFALNGFLNTWIETGSDNAQYLNVGDTNEDGFYDIVVVTDKKATLYTSRIRGVNVDYVKTTATSALNVKGANSQYAVAAGDLDRDGVQEIAFIDYNENNYQTFAIHNGKTLEKMITLCPEGVYDYQIFNFLDFDINGDGYNEIYYLDGMYYLFRILDGRSGEVLKTISPNELEDYDSGKGDYQYHPEYIVPFPTESMPSSLMVYNDINGDGISEFMTVKEYYDRDSWGYHHALVVYSGADFQILKVINIAASGYEQMPTPYAIESSENYYALRSNNRFSLLDCDQAEIVASFAVDGDRFILVNDKTMVVTNSNGGMYHINIEKSFEMRQPVVATTDAKSILLSWEPLVEYSDMSIYDNGDLVYSGTDTEYEINLLSGHHDITLTMADAFGKSSSQTYSVEVAEHPNHYYWLIGVAGVVLVLTLYLNLIRKMKVRKQIKEEF